MKNVVVDFVLNGTINMEELPPEQRLELRRAIGAMATQLEHDGHGINNAELLVGSNYILYIYKNYPQAEWSKILTEFNSIWNRACEALENDEVPSSLVEDIEALKIKYKI